MHNEFEGSLTSIADQSVGIVVSRFNEEITKKLLDGALRTLYDHGVKRGNIDIVWVPGAWEIPLAARRLARAQRYAGLVCLGAVIRGETTHDQHINRFVSLAIGWLGLEYDLPIGLGLLTCNDDRQAAERAGGEMGNKGAEATAAMLRMVGLLKALDKHPGAKPHAAT